MHIKRDLENVFFESAIVDIDFSRWASHVQFCVMRRWNFLAKPPVPEEEVCLVKFRGIRKLTLEFEPTFEQAERTPQKPSYAIEVSGARYERGNNGRNTLHLDAPFITEFFIVFETAEIVLP